MVKFLQIASYYFIFSESSWQPNVPKNTDGSFLNSECETPILGKSTSANMSQLNNQLIEIWKSRHQEYISSNCNAVIDDIKKDTQIDNYDINKKINSHEVVNRISPKA